MENQEPSQLFAEEIDFSELQFIEVVGRGAFGVVSRARWRNMDVAVKLIETETEKKAFITELKQLSRVNHPNIVQLYGACTNQPVCLVMEYAEGGSLYNVLHGAGPQPMYTAAHAMSWGLQCAGGVNYLHNMKPKPLIHRDLKPPNLLLIAGGTQLKICDFGTACDAHTHMTNNKGSAAWMAPEVFEGSNYSEKCDVFSFGIILWEVITRRKPFDEIGGPAFRIMWAVHNGTRPPLVKMCPKPIEILMTRCWHANPVERPSMAEVQRIMTHLFQFFEGADVPLVYPQTEEVEGGFSAPGTQVMSSVFDTPPLTNTNQSQLMGSSDPRGHTIQDTVRMALHKLGEPVPIPPTHPRTKPRVVEDGNHQRTSAPASLAASRESLLDNKGSRSSTPSFDIVTKRYSADLSKLEEIDILKQAGAKAANQPPPANGAFGSPYLPQIWVDWPETHSVRGHRRSGSHGTSFLRSGSAGAGTSPTNTISTPVRGHRRTGSYGNSPVVTSSADLVSETPTMSHCPTAPARLVNSTENPLAAFTPGQPVNISLGGFAGPGVTSSDAAAANMAFVAMDHQLQPLAPCPTSPESMAIFEQHCQFAQEYLRVQTEIALLNQRNEDLAQELQLGEDLNSSRTAEEYTQLASENEALMLLHKNLKKQMEMIRQQQGRRYGGGAGGTGGR